MVAITWCDDEESGFEENAEPKEMTNLCLMAHEEENGVSTSISSQFTFNELHDTFDDLMVEFKKIGIKNSILKKIISTLLKENENLQNKIKDLKN